MTYLKEFQDCIKKNDYPRFLKLWEEYCYSDEPDVEELKQILLSVKASDLAKPFGSHVSRALLLWDSLPASPAKHEIIRLIFDIENTNNADLSEKAYSYLKNLYPNDLNFENKIKIIGLKSGEDFQGCISHFELLTHLNKNNFVFHTAGWGTGEIMEVSELREEVTCEFEFVLGLKTLSFANAMKTLKPLSNDHFLARRFGNPDLLEKEAKENPVAIIKLLLKDLGPKNAQEIKDEMSELVIPEEEWNKFWQNAKAHLKKDTQIEFPKSAQDPFYLLKEHISHEETLYKALETKLSTEQIILLIYNYIKDFPQTLKNADFVQKLLEKIESILADPNLKIAEKLQLFFIEEDLKKEIDFTDILKQIQKFPETLEQITSVTYKKRFLQEIKKHISSWEDIFLQSLLTTSQNPIKDYILDEFLSNQSKKKLEKHLYELATHPLLYPQTLFWYFQKILKDSELPLANAEGIKKFFEACLILLDHLCQKNLHKEIVKKMLSLLTENKYELIREIFQKTSIQEAKEYILLSTKCRCFSPNDLKIISALGQVAHPSLKLKKEVLVSDANSTVFWTTVESYEKTQKKIKQLAGEETIKNAKEIEEARALGDLRENAEYKAALERRARIQSDLQRLTEELNHARIITPNDINTDKVGVGTKVVCENDKKEKMEFTILGSWDANPEKNILSLKSKLAQAMEGLTVTETFSFQGETFKILSISSYFE
jgi:transcription elongation factor GreA-like protein/transcription elongation GreA/GreB family factor